MQTTDNNSSILSRIKKLQNLTTERGATPEEAASAAAKAQALLFEHNLHQAQVDTTDPTQSSKPDPYGRVTHEHDASKATISWRRSLLHVIAKNNFCSTVYTPNTTNQTIIGKRSNVETVLYLNQCVANQIEDLATRAARTQLTDKAPYKTSFCMGAVATIAARLSEQRAQSEYAATQTTTSQTTTQATSNALVIRNSAADLQNAVAKFYPRLRSGSTRSTIRHSDGFAAGRQAGHTVSMSKGLTSRQGRIA